MWAELALSACNDLEFSSVLDIGSGGGEHSRHFRNLSKKVTTVNLEPPADIVGDYLRLDLPRHDLVWASHVLEHQPNPNLFLKKCFKDTKRYFCVTVPPAKHDIVGGHLTLWNAGLLVYNMIIAGWDCRHAKVMTYGYNISVLVEKKKAELPTLYMDNGDIELLVNQDYELDIRAVDPDNDFMTVSLFRNVFFDDFEFIDGEGQGSATGTLRWRPNCGLLGANLSPRDYAVSFLARDLRCPNAEADTLEITFTLREPLAGEIPFLPANAFSPNGDGINEVFTLSGLDLPERNLPPNQCENVFENIQIFDRTGKEVYSSIERTFQWTGDGASSGTYFYLIKYTSTEYKGYVTMVY